jgi:hypothetical protein
MQIAVDFRMSRTVMVAVLAAGAYGPSFPSPRSVASQPLPPRGAQPGAGPARGVFPPNATRVTATVQKVSGDTLTLEILQARQARPDMAIGPAVGTIDALSREPLDPALAAGRRIEAVVSIVGDTLASRWVISEIHILPDR